MTSSITGPISRSEVTKPDCSALVESLSSRSMPSSRPSRAKPPRSVRRPSSGSWSILKSPVCSTTPARVLIATAMASGIEWLTAKNSSSKAVVRCLLLGDLVQHRRDAVLLQLGREQREGEPGADDRDAAPLAQQVGHRAEVVLVPVGQHDALDVVEAVTDVGEVREDEVDPGLLLLGEQHAAVDDHQPAGVLEHGHVAADLGQPAEGDDPQAAPREGGRRAQLGVRVAHSRGAFMTGLQRVRGRRAGPRPARAWRRRGEGGRDRRRGP